MASATTLEPVDRATKPAVEEALYEVVDGQRVELPPMSSYATWIASRLQTRLDSFAELRKLGTVVDEMLFIFDAQRDIRRRPDVAFVSAARWPLDQPVPKTGDWEVVPDLAIEVISPNDTMEAVIAKLTEYFRFGVKQVWY